MDLDPTPNSNTETECQYMDLDPTPKNNTKETECQYMDLYPTPNKQRQTGNTKEKEKGEHTKKTKGCRVDTHTIKNRKRLP